MGLALFIAKLKPWILLWIPEKNLILSDYKLILLYKKDIDINLTQLYRSRVTIWDIEGLGKNND